VPSFISQLLPIYARLRRVNRNFVDPAAARRRVEERRATPATASVPASVERRFAVKLDTSRGWPVYQVEPRDGGAQGAVIYLHGGAWVNEIAPQHWQLIAQIAEGAATRVIVPLYPLVPHGTAAQVVDAVTTIAENAQKDFGTVVLAGDSAGGQIALSAAQVLRDRRGVVLPATILIAPGLDLSMSNPGILAVQPHDPWLAMPGMQIFIDEWRADLAVDDPRVSPLFGDLSGLGPLTIYTGTRDILNPDAHLLAERARAVGVTVEFHEQEGLLHVYPLLPTSEGRFARRQIVATVKAALRS
jgi:acetyl esterase/lipase